MDINIKPILTEPGIKYFLNETLKQCQQFREKYNNNIYNIGLFFLFLLILAIVLIYKYKGKLTPEELEEKDTEKKQYILSKIKNYQQAKLKAQQDLITSLPNWENEFDIIYDNPLKKLRS